MQTMYKGNIDAPKTALSAAISASSTTITVANGQVLPDAPNLAVLGEGSTIEIVLYGAKNGNVLSSVTRGLEGVALPWPANTSVSRRLTAYDYNALVENILMLKARIDSISAGRKETRDILAFAKEIKKDAALLISQSHVTLTIPLFSNRVVHFGTKFFVDAQEGNDSQDGLSPATAKKTIGAAIELAQNEHHDIIFIRGGTYTETVHLNKSTTWLVGYGGNVTVDGINRRVINPNGTRIDKSTRRSNIAIDAPYCVIMNIDSVNSPYFGFDLSPRCRYGMLINCSATDGADVGFICSDEYGSPTGEAASFNQFIGCTSSFNFDFDSGLFGGLPGSSADGFEDEGVGNCFIECKAYANSDDGFDLFRTSMGSLYHCTAFYSGRTEPAYQGARNRTAEKALVRNPAAQGDGNNFKMGPGNGIRTDTVVDGGAKSKAVGCLSAYARSMGFTSNQGMEMTLIHCTGIGNLNRNFFSDVSSYGRETILVQNCLSYGGGTIDTLYGNAIQNSNSWNLGVSVGTGDFVSLDPAHPDFGVLAEGSPLKNRTDLVNDGYTLARNNDLGWSEVLGVMPQITFQAAGWPE